jgi:hypothetical protein
MRRESSEVRRKRAFAAGAGLVAGVTAGAALLALASVAVAHRLTSAADADPGALIEVTHVPPLLTVDAEPVELRYDVYCAAPGPDPESGAPCDAAGTVHVRRGQSGAFQSIPLRLDPDASHDRYVAEVPDAVASGEEGFSYYAVLRNVRTGAETTLPAGGETAPQRSSPLGHSVAVALGGHSFGSVRRADARIASARWGAGHEDVGLEEGPLTAPIGATSFDVEASGTVAVLDEAKHRMLRFRAGKVVGVVPLEISGTLADMSIGADGTIYVLETAGQGPDSTPLLRSFQPNGDSKASWHAAERTVSAVRMGPDGPVTLEYPAAQWMPAEDHGGVLERKAQEQRGRPGRPLPGSDDVVVLRTGKEVRVALVGPGGVNRSWRVESETPIAEVQLAEPLGNRLVLVFRVYTDSRDEFVALVLDGKGLVERFSLESSDWAEAAPISRFRLAGSSLYQLGSTPTGMFVDRFDLEVRQ